jgi:hypothetical protein
VFEFTIDLGPLHLAIRIGEPSTAGDEYAALYTDTELAEPDTTEDDPRLGFRGC